MKITFLYVFLAIGLGWMFLFWGEKSEAVDLTKNIEGTVEAVSSGYINIADADNKLEQIAVDSTTVYDNVQKLSDLKLGDRVQIDYGVDNGKRLAITVTKLEVQVAGSNI